MNVVSWHVGVSYGSPSLVLCHYSWSLAECAHVELLEQHPASRVVPYSSFFCSSMDSNLKALKLAGDKVSADEQRLGSSIAVCLQVLALPETAAVISTHDIRTDAQLLLLPG